ncbi:MAG TPA: hypothetical protein VL172_13575 [Kofleriaceae bacterium]|nr:hypothetical protein [Kofleriaceae bacterium]
MNPRLLLVLLAATGLSACAGDGRAAPEILAHDFPALSLQPGDELNFVCQSWTLGNDEPLYVSSLQVAGGPGWHHSNWLYADEGEFPGPDGTWDCAERGFSLVDAGLSGGVLFSQSVEAEADGLVLAPGEAVVIPAHAKIIAEVHLLNAGDAAMTTHMHAELGLVPADQVGAVLRPLALSYYPLELPPMSASEFTAACDLAQVQGGALDFAIHFVQPHYHAMGTGMRIESYRRGGGSSLIYQTDQRIGTPMGATLTPAVDLAGADGIRFTCSYTNYETEPVGYDSSEKGEMCVMFALTDSPMRWIGGVLPDTDTVPIASTTDSAIQSFTGDCQVFALE